MVALLLVCERPLPAKRHGFQVFLAGFHDHDFRAAQSEVGQTFGHVRCGGADPVHRVARGHEEATWQKHMKVIEFHSAYRYHRNRPVVQQAFEAKRSPFGREDEIIANRAIHQAFSLEISLRNPR